MYGYYSEKFHVNLFWELHETMRFTRVEENEISVPEYIISAHAL